MIESREVFTQAELDEALGRPGVIPVCAGDGAFEAGGDAFVRVVDAAHVVLRDAATAEAGGQATVSAHDRADVTARDTATVTVRDAATARAHGRTSVSAGDESWVSADGQAVVSAQDAAVVTVQGAAAVTAGERCSVRACGSARVEVFGTARAWVWGATLTRVGDQARVTAWGSATVHANGEAQVEALETAVVFAAGPVSVTALGEAVVRAKGRADVVQAAPGAAPHSAEEWCAYYGVDVADGVATLYKAVDEDFGSYYGGSYVPGTEPAAPDWDGGERECGGGLHLSPRPTFGLLLPDDRARFVACPVRVADIAFHDRGRYRGKVKVPRVCAPVYEVNEDGSRI